MRVTFFPFYSQQDKRTGKFLPESDSGVRMYHYMAEAGSRIGWDTRLVVPLDQQCVQPFLPAAHTMIVPYRMDSNNLRRRFQMHLGFVDELARSCDVLVTTHVGLPYVMRCLHPKVKTVLEAGFLPETSFQGAEVGVLLNWRSADVVHCSSERIENRLYDVGVKQVFRWPFAYEDSTAQYTGVARDIDVLFNARCSAVGYTNHEAFLRAMEGSPWKVVVPDPTSFVRPAHPDMVLAAPPNRAEYLKLLHHSKVVVSLTDNGGGGFGFQEAVAAGCCPVTLSLPEYHEVLTTKWPYYASLSNVREVVEHALKLGWAGCSTKVVRAVQENIKKSSYSAAWTGAKADLEGLCR